MIHSAKVTLSGQITLPITAAKLSTLNPINTNTGVYLEKRTPHAIITIFIINYHIS